jgi:hypothetical protein
MTENNDSAAGNDTMMLDGNEEKANEEKERMRIRENHSHRRGCCWPHCNRFVDISDPIEGYMPKIPSKLAKNSKTRLRRSKIFQLMHREDDNSVGKNLHYCLDHFLTDRKALVADELFNPKDGTLVAGALPADLATYDRIKKNSVLFQQLRQQMVAIRAGIFERIESAEIQPQAHPAPAPAPVARILPVAAELRKVKSLLKTSNKKLDEAHKLVEQLRKSEKRNNYRFDNSSAETVLNLCSYSRKEILELASHIEGILKKICIC